MGNQRGVSLSGLIWALAILGFLSVMAAKLMPAYIEYFTVKKILASMEQAGDLKGSVRDSETVVSVAWSAKVPLVSNFAACLDFAVTTAK